MWWNMNNAKHRPAHGTPCSLDLGSTERSVLGFIAPPLTRRRVAADWFQAGGRLYGGIPGGRTVGRGEG